MKSLLLQILSGCAVLYLIRYIYSIFTIHYKVEYRIMQPFCISYIFRQLKTIHYANYVCNMLYYIEHLYIHLFICTLQSGKTFLLGFHYQTVTSISVFFGQWTGVIVEFLEYLCALQYMIN